MIKVINIMHDKSECVFIGRGSPWGNPFKIGRDGDRAKVIERYRNYILANNFLLNRLGELSDQVLGCFCKPLPCHGDVLKELVEKMEKENSLLNGQKLQRNQK